MTTSLRSFLVLALVLSSIPRSHSHWDGPTDFDYIILGSGSAGSDLAGRLSEDPTNTVLLVERGYDVSDDPTTSVPTVNSVIPNARSLGLLPTESIIHSESLLSFDPTTYCPFALGGGPAVSGSFWGRGSPRYFDEMASSMGDQSLSYQNLLPFFKATESVDPYDSASPDRGRDGPIQIRFLDPNDQDVSPFVADMSRVFNVSYGLDYATSNGIEGIWPMQRSLSRATCNETYGQCVRQSSYDCYVRPHLDRPNLHVLKESVAISLILDGMGGRGKMKARGARVLVGQEKVVIDFHAREEVIVSLGTINSAKLMMLSGLGDPAILEPLGIDVVKSMPGVGKNYRDHAVIQFAYYVPGVRNIQVPSSVRISFFKSETRTNVDRDVDIEIAWGLLPGPVLVGFIVQVKDANVGQMSIRSKDPIERVNLQLDLDPDRLDPMVWAFRKVREWLGGTGIELVPGTSRVPQSTTDDQVKNYLKDNVASWFHMTGTCRMGKEEDPMAVVDTNFRVHGVRGLRIVDGSVLPTVPQTHPSGTITMLGERCAHLIKNGDDN